MPVTRESGSIIGAGLQCGSLPRGSQLDFDDLEDALQGTEV